MKIRSAVLTSLALVSLPAFAGSTAPLIDGSTITTTEGPKWSFQLDLYGWAESLDGDLGIGRFSVPVDVGFDDILESLDFGYMGAAGVRYGKWSFVADVVYASVSADTDILGGRVPLGLKEDQFLGNFVLGYEVLRNETMSLDVYGGVRVNSIDVELNARRPRFDRSWDESWVDPIIGARFQKELSDKWFFRAVGDVGGFGVESDFTWQAMAGFGYRVTENGALLLAFRGLGTDYSSGRFTYDVTGYGPLIGFETRF